MNLVGNLLIAPPAVKGNFWHKSVIIITEHHNNGSVGLVINKRSDLTIKEFGDQLGITLDVPGYVYVGGPINNQSLSFLHTTEWSSKNTMRISHSLCISSAEDILPRMAMGDVPHRWRLFLGMAGWASGQLESEVKGRPPYHHNTSWCTVKSDLDTVFGSDAKEQWTTALDKSASEFAQKLLT